MAEATHHHFNTFMIMCRTMNCLKSWLSPLAECVAWLLFHFRNMAAVFIYVAAAHTSASLYFPLLHPGWNCYHLLVTVFLPKCMFTVIPLGNRQSFIVDNPNWIEIRNLELSHPYGWCSLRSRAWFGVVTVATRAKRSTGNAGKDDRPQFQLCDVQLVSRRERQRIMALRWWGNFWTQPHSRLCVSRRH